MHAKSILNLLRQAWNQVKASFWKMVRYLSSRLLQVSTKEILHTPSQKWTLN
jgi:hypothetical protein